MDAHIGRSLGKRWCAVCGGVLRPGEEALRLAWSPGGALQAGHLALWLCMKHGEDVLTALELRFKLHRTPPLAARGVRLL